MHDIQINTERLLLRPLKIADAEDVFEWVSDERISDGKLIGSGDIGFNSSKGCWSFGYNFRYDCWGMGYATEAVKAMMNYAHINFGARKFVSSHCEPNLASGNVMKKCGLHFVGYGKF